MAEAEKNTFKGKYSKFPDDKYLNTDPLVKYLFGLDSRIKELETQVCNLNEKVLCANNNAEAITDTERLDFIENETMSIEFSKFMGKNTFEIVSYDDKPSGRTIREAIDAAMRGKDD